MPSLKTDLVRRVERIPKPTRTSQALIPLFEAISNSIHSVKAAHGKGAAKNGRIIVDIQRGVGRKRSTIVVSDNGTGLDKKNFEAFEVTDTANKIEIGGKGVGRLLWLDCFEKIRVESTYIEEDRFRQRSFNFKLSNSDQIDEYSDKIVRGRSLQSGMIVSFEGIKQNGYSRKFPTRLGHIYRHLTSHFLPTFINANSPILSVTCGDETRHYPDEIDKSINRREDIDLESATYGKMSFVMMECDKVASADLKGRHFVHFIAHDRTVVSHPIDGRIGLKNFGAENNLVFHACLQGKYLDRNVNQERTGFNFEDSVLENIINSVCMQKIQEFLKHPLQTQKISQSKVVSRIIETYPSVAFGSVDELQKFVPLGETKDDAIYAHLSQQRFRQDVKQAEKVQSVFARLKGERVDAESFMKAFADAASAIEENEQRSLTEYVVRRKVILDLLELLVEKVRNSTEDSAYQREDVLHSFICPMQVNALNEEPLSVAPASHDLWVIDERLTFAQYFSSDVSFSEMAAYYQSEDRPDLLIFDRVHGLKDGDGTSKVLLVEFKRPGRSDYKENENPQLQIERYVRKLLTKPDRDVRGRPININGETVFYCFVVADCLGKLDDWTYSWGRTADGRGRLYRPETGFKGTIELVEWDSLIRDAKERNRAFFDKSGLSGNSIFSKKSK